MEMGFVRWRITAVDIGITGIGTATPLGCSYRSVADSLLAGRSGIRKVTRFRADDHLSQIGGAVDEIPLPAGFDAATFATFPAVDQLALWCCAEALRDAGWQDASKVRIGL